MRVYIAGPIQGYDNDNRQAFTDATQEVEEMGHVPMSPHAIIISDGSWCEYMRADIKMLLDCEAVYMLIGWERSRGATLELHIATQVGLKVLFQPFLPKPQPQPSELDALREEHRAASHLMHLQAGVSKSGGDPAPSEWDEAWDRSLAAHRAVDALRKEGKT